MSVTVDGDVLEALLPNMSPGKMYQVTVSAVKGLEESEPGTDTLTTGRLTSRHLERPSQVVCMEHNWACLCSSALDKPTGLTAVNVTDSSALLLWQPLVATVDGYVITYSFDSGVPALNVNKTERRVKEIPAPGVDEWMNQIP